MLVPKFLNNDDHSGGKSTDLATMNQNGGQSSRNKERARPQAQIEDSEEDHAAEKAHLMLSDLGLDRASFVTAADSARNSLPINVAALERGRAFRQPGTAEYAAAQEVKSQLEAWDTAYVKLRDDGADDGKADLSKGQEHRTRMLQMLQQAPPVAGSRGGGQGGHARGNGRGGGVIGTRGRGDRTVSSSHQRLASQVSNRQGNQGNTVTQSLAVPMVTNPGASLPCPRHRARPRASASPRGRGSRADISKSAGSLDFDVSVGRASSLPIDAPSSSTRSQRWSGAMTDRASVVRLSTTRPTRASPNLVNPSDFMSAMAHLYTPRLGDVTSGSAEIHVEGTSTTTVEEIVKSTIKDSSDSISVKTPGTEHKIIAPPEIIFSPEIDSAPYGVRVLTPPPAPQGNISTGTYSDDLIGLNIDVPPSVKVEEVAAEDEHAEADRSSSEQVQSTTEQTIDLSNAQILLNTLRELSGLSSIPSVTEAITDLQNAIKKLRESNAVISTRSGVETSCSFDDSSTHIQVEAECTDRATACSGGDTQGTDIELSSPLKSSASSAVSQPKITTSSHRGSTLSQSGNLSTRLRLMQDQWTNGVITREREVSSVMMRDLEQSLHHDPSVVYQPVPSTRVRLSMTNLGEYLLPVGNRNEQTAPLYTPRTTLTQNEVANNIVMRGQNRKSNLQELKFSSHGDQVFAEKAAHGKSKIDHYQQENQQTGHGSQDLYAYAPQDETNPGSRTRDIVDSVSVAPIQPQSSAAVTLSHGSESTSFHRPEPNSTGLTSCPAATGNNTVDAVQRPIVPNNDSVTIFSQALASSTQSAPRVNYARESPIARSRPRAGTSSSSQITISPSAQRLPSHCTVTRDSEATSTMATRIAPSTLCTSSDTAAPLSTASALCGIVDSSICSVATRSISSTLTEASNAAVHLPTATPISVGVDASQWSTSSSALPSTLLGTGLMTAMATGTALGGDVSASRWSTATEANGFFKSRRSTARETSVPASYTNLSARELRSTKNHWSSSDHSQLLRGSAAGPSRLSTSADLGLNDTNTLFTNYQRPQAQQTPNVPEFILQARALQNDPGAAARAQYGISNNTPTTNLENQPFNPSLVSVPESASSNLARSRSKNPWESVHHHCL
ncbi:hypothetical protein MMC26_002715 [Xylographa opegraphella]|nr:hypothetical protein [Xylographa opegraphella]